MSFEEMGLSPELLKGIEELGFENATPIQEQVIPALLAEKRDLIGLAQTGTGKTAAFGLPALQKLDIDSAVPQLLIMSPTRELCMQIARDLKNYGKFIDNLHIVAVYGGADISKQISALSHGAHVIVATPGRIHDLVRRRRVDLSKVSTLVLDEADEMLKMGFREDVDAILAQTPKEKNTLLFSATMSPDILAITKHYMKNPMEITVGHKNAGADNVSHIYHMVHAKDRYDALKRVVDYYPDIYGLVFCRTRMECKEVAAHLMRDGYNAEALHGDLSQSQRDYVMQKFRDRNLSVLVATDVAARGLDVNSLTHVINYNLPDDLEIYTHRSGRTGRAGKEGVAVSIINTRERGRLSQIERVLCKKISSMPVPSGPEICERRLFDMIERMKNTPVDQKQIDLYIDKAYEMLNDLSKEDIIKQFVSMEFSRFLDYYKNAPDLNATSKPSFDGERTGGERGRRKRGGSMSRIVLNIGKGKNITKREIIDIVAGVPGAKGAEIGLIEIYKKASSVEVDSAKAQEIIGQLNEKSYKGVRIVAEENKEQSEESRAKSSDFRAKREGQRSQGSETGTQGGGARRSFSDSGEHRDRDSRPRRSFSEGGRRREFSADHSSERKRKRK